MQIDNLKKGTRVKLAIGWEADLVDNKKGTIRFAEVYGAFTETGSIYCHDIVAYRDANGHWQTDVEYSKSQLHCKKLNEALFR